MKERRQVTTTLKATAVFLMAGFVLNVQPLIGLKIKKLSKMDITTQNGSPPGGYNFFVVMEGEQFLFSDLVAGDIKIYEMLNFELKLKHRIGKRGIDTEKFAKPSYSFYNKREGKFGLLDYATRKFHIYNTHKAHNNGNPIFTKEKEIFCPPWAGTDFNLLTSKVYNGDNTVETLDHSQENTTDHLIIAGYCPDTNNNHFDLYSINVETGDKSFLLSSHIKYGFRSVKEYEDKYINDILYKAVGSSAWFDIHGDFAYYVWEGDLKIFKINIKTKEFTVFGNKDARKYRLPFPPSEDMVAAYIDKDQIKTLEERDKVSYVKNIFTSSNSVLVIYNEPKTGDVINIWLQFYSLDGQFQNEILLEPEVEGNKIFQPDGNRMWFDKEKNILYALATDKTTVLKYDIK